MGIFGSIGKALGKVPGLGAVGAGAAKLPGVGAVGKPLGLPSTAAPVKNAVGPARPLAATPNLAAAPVVSADAGALGSDADLAKPAAMARRTFSQRGFRGGRR
jgi:hypothetical protein